MNRLTMIIVTLTSLALLAIACTSSGTQAPPPSPVSATVFPMATQAPPPTPANTSASPLLTPPTPMPPIHGFNTIPPTGAYEAPSIDQQILESDRIVVASFVSATAAIQTVPGDPGTSATYRPMQVLTFRALEYLKGTGPTQFTVEVLDSSYGYEQAGEVYSGYLTQEAAMTVATDLLAQRNTTWDNRPGVLFMKGPLDSVAPTGGDSRTSSDSTNQAFGFVQSNVAVQGDFAYTVDTLSRTWLPAKEAPTEVASRSSANAEFITDGTETPHQVTTLSALKTRISEIQEMLVLGTDIEGYEECVYGKLVRERYFRNWTGPLTREATVDSGSASAVDLKQSGKIYDENYSIFTESGKDAAHFASSIKDSDNNAANGYQYVYATARPLPVGKYVVNFHSQLAKQAVCDHNPIDNNFITYNITVTAPAATLHEAFFDPTAIGAAVGADGTNGVLKPTSFTIGETAAEITGLKWENNQAVLTLNPHVSLTNRTLEFIELDGSVSLTLRGNDATQDSTAGTHTWPVPTQPWHHGDLLMLRIREDAPTPTLSPTATP